LDSGAEGEKVLKKKVMRRMFGSKKDEPTGEQFKMTRSFTVCSFHLVLLD
jgi:hypothetical protein